MNQFVLKKKTQFFFLNFHQVINISSTVIILPILLYSLTPESYGLWQYVLTFQAFALIFTASQTTSASKRGLTMKKMGTFYFALIKRAQLALIPSVIFLFASGIFYVQRTYILSVLLLVSIFYLYINSILIFALSEYFIATEQFKKWSSWQIVSGSLPLILSGAVAFFSRSILSYAVFYVVCSTIVSGYELVVLTRKKGLWAAYKRNEIDTSCFTYGIRSIPNGTIGAISLKIVDVIIANAFGYTELAIFSVAQKIRNVIASVLKTIGPLVYSKFAKQQMEWGKKTIKRALTVSFLAGIGMSFLAVFVSVVYIELFLPAFYRPAILYMFILSSAIPFVIPITLLYTFLDSHMRFKAIMFATIIPDSLKIVLVCLFGYVFGIAGMVVALAIHTLLSFFFFLIAVYKKEQVTQLMERIPFFSRFVVK